MSQNMQQAQNYYNMALNGYIRPLNSTLCTFSEPVMYLPIAHFIMHPWNQIEFHNPAQPNRVLIVPDQPNQPPPEVNPQPVQTKSKRRHARNLYKEIVSARKNSESNIVNHFFSYYSHPDQATPILHRCAASLKKNPQQMSAIIPLFFNTLRYMNLKRGRKYINTNILLNFFNPQLLQDHLDEMKDKIKLSGVITMAQLCELFRRCLRYFLNSTSLNAILTSKRLSIASKYEHLKKRRRVRRKLSIE